MTTKSEIRKEVGRGKFTVAEFAEARGVKPTTARRTLRELRESNVVEVVGSERITTEEGKGSRGRPRFQYKVTEGK